MPIHFSATFVDVNDYELHR